MGKIKPWARWETLGDLGSGGQGTTQLVRDRETGVEGVLKTLNRPRDPDRRARFCREASVLRTLAHPRIPALLDTNADRFAEVDVPLFMVQTRIVGSTLASYVGANGPVPLEAGLALTKGLLDVLEYCHRERVGHRDVKPDNVIVRVDDPTDPVLVDFGQAFDAEETPGATEPGQILGNRFLALPELATGVAKRDHRSDLTQLAGLFFYAVTGIIPMQLRDAEQRPPHHRAEAAPRLLKADPGARCTWFFDRAFQHSPSDRFQDAAELGDALRYIASADRTPLSAILSPLNVQLARSPVVQGRENWVSLRDGLVKIGCSAAKAVHAEITAASRHTLCGVVKEHGSPDCQIQCGVGVNELGRVILIVHVMQVDAAFRVWVTLHESEEVIEQFVTSVFEPSVPADFQARLAAALGRELARKLR